MVFFYARTTDYNGEVKLNVNIQLEQYIIISMYNKCGVSKKITMKN